ncbi:thiamine phosphate synthase [Kineococcus siccus]|uniref:thiamine phosphate synthase n=1 Tax=Kineococcus siccus TaxID=2696567 RepID=UPI00196B9510|nr:thiamine phosphate synthase [Kineococcus siccus]
MRAPLDLSLYLVTDTALCGTRGVADVVRAGVAGGVTAVQVRAKDAPDRELLALVRSVQEVLRDTGVALLVDDAVDVALLAGADGVHLGQSDLPAAQVRDLVGPDLLLGLSVSSVEEVRAAPLDALDYLGVGPVWATPTKPRAAAPLGPAGVAAVVAAAALPCVAIGGLHAGTVAALRDTGVAGFCVVSEICAAADPAAAARGLRAAGALA